ncbi:penicillin-binding protein 1C [Desulfobacula toluolica]|uniref:peptidoglycan glycosyltransferase n=1 Tax=Desulfobacula toluolica (strain DSM 7467 / Tol2) TaxID=651182 RepID=K0NL45_DESTT|nr:penicillin-binding protein 1C [Desulfobacula toluolica]CCK80673.1 PbpC: penicillin-binding protein 1C 2.4.2.- [Desulfobacula toluolica Tol2]
MKSRHVKYCVVSVCLASAVVIVCLSGLDRIYPLNLKTKTCSTLITAKDGTPLRAFADKNGVWRYPTDLTDVSPLYLQALLTYEDRWFYSHPGVNPFAFIRACFQNIAAGKIVSGGSTLTMQVARLLHPNQRTLAGKILQMLRAFQLEIHLTKDQIMTLYLNLAPFGSNIEGVQTACFSWLGKQAMELSCAEAALLAVLPQAPSFYRPDRHPERARKARDKVLDRMAFFKVWTNEQVRAAKKEPVAALRFVPPMTAPLASRRLYFGTDNPSSKKTTTLDYDLQIQTEDIVRDYVAGLSDEQSAAALVVNYKTLEVQAYVGSADFFSTKRKGHVDMVRAIRSPGSTLKPFLYGLAMDEGLIHSHSLLLDTPRFQKEYEPGNFSKGFSGPVTVARALRLSLNVPAVQVLEAYGPQKFYDRLINAGARIKLSGKPNLSIILGGAGTNLESLVTLYTGLARDGITGKPKLLKQDADQDADQERYLMSPGAAWIISKILAQPMPGFEGINRLSGHIPMAWKTGTSYGFRDAWALGIMGDYVAGVWVGRPDGSPCPGQYGAVTAIPLLRRIFESLPLTDFIKKPPSSVQPIKICWPLGSAKTRTITNCFVQHDAWILDNQIPLTLNSATRGFDPLLKTFWIDENGNRAQPSCGGIKKIRIGVWPQGAEPWLPPSWRRNKLIAPPSQKCPDLASFPGNPVQITSVFNNSILTRPPGQATPPSIPITALGGQGKYYWFLNKKLVAVINPGSAGVLPMPLPGTYQLSVADEAGSFDVIDFEVISMD